MPHFMFEKLLLALECRGKNGEHIVDEEYNNRGYSTKGLDIIHLDCFGYYQLWETNDVLCE